MRLNLYSILKNIGYDLICFLKKKIIHKKFTHAIILNSYCEFSIKSGTLPSQISPSI